MGIKAGVRVYGIRPEMVLCDSVVRDVFKAHSIPCWRTSIVRPKNKASLHPEGFATDYRTRHIVGTRRRATIDAIHEDLKEALPCCDIVFEKEGEEQEHFHIEFDPKDDPEFRRNKEIYKLTGNWPK